MPDIRVKVEFDDRDAVPADLVNVVVRDVERVIYKEEEGLLAEALRVGEEEIDSVTRDAILFRFQQLRGRSLLIESVDRGSLIVVGVVGAAALWVLKNTAGESLKGAWKDSDLDRRLQLLLRRRFDRIAERVAQGVRRKHRRGDRVMGQSPRSVEQTRSPTRRRQLKWVAERVEVISSPSGDRTIRIVAVSLEITEGPTTYGELMGDGDNEVT